MKGVDLQVSMSVKEEKSEQGEEEREECKVREE